MKLILNLKMATNKLKTPKGWKLWEQHFRDIHKSPFFEASCPHGVGHHKGVHGCDGCCRKILETEMWAEVTED